MSSQGFKNIQFDNALTEVMVSQNLLVMYLRSGMNIIF